MQERRTLWGGGGGGGGGGTQIDPPSFPLQNIRMSTPAPYLMMSPRFATLHQKQKTFRGSLFVADITFLDLFIGLKLRGSKTKNTKPLATRCQMHD